MLTMSDPYALTTSLGYRMTLVSRISERRFEAALTPLGLSRVTWCVLMAVGQEDLQNPSDIADWIGIDRTATSRALKRLEADGLITRAPGLTDKRTRITRATPDGLDRLKQANAAAEENATHFNAKLSWYERDMLVTILNKLMQDESRGIPGL